MPKFLFNIDYQILIVPISFKKNLNLIVHLFWAWIFCFFKGKFSVVGHILNAFLWMVIANIKKTQIFHRMLHDLKDHLRALFGLKGCVFLKSFRSLYRYITLTSNFCSFFTITLFFDFIQTIQRIQQNGFHRQKRREEDVTGKIDIFC